MSLVANLQLADYSVHPRKLAHEEYFSVAGLTATSYFIATDGGIGSDITPEGIFTAYSDNDITSSFHTTNTDGKVSLFLKNDTDINWNLTLDGTISDSLHFINDTWQSEFSNPFYALTMQPDGKVGIGTETTATDVTLDVQAYDSLSASLRMFNNATNVDVRMEAGTGVGRVGTKTNTPLRLFANDTDGIYIGTDGNVGIGTASDPAYALTIDGNINLIGSQAQGGNVLAYWFETANTNDAFRDSKIGIGTGGDDPEATLQVIEGSGAGTIQIGKDLAGYNNLYQNINFGGNVDTDVGWQIGKADTSGTYSTTKGFYIYGFENQVKALAIDIQGNIAIGSNNVTPTALLDVRGNVIFNDAAADFDFRVEGQTDANLLFTDASTDRVGIGLNNPQYKLDIVGDINYTSRLYQNDVLMGMWTDDAGDIYRMSNVGIGVADPQQKFHIRDVASNLRFYNSAGVFVVDSVNDAADNNINLRIMSEELEIYTNGAERVRVDDAGQVGINTITPGHMLDVNGNVGISPNTEGHDTHFFTTNAVDDGRYQIKSGASVNVDIQANGNTYFNGGNVGIGIAIPTEKLQVIGDILIDTGTTSTLYFDDNTNWFQYASGEYRIGLANTEHIRINSSGYVGINEDVPDSPLHIKGAAGTASSIKVEEDANARYTLIQQNAGSATFRAEGASNVLGLYTAGTEWVRIDTTGRVGINQLNPLATLHVDGTVIIENDTINELTFTGTGLTNILSETTTGFQLGSTAAGYLSFISNNTEAIHVDSAQLVGINNSNPQHRLDVDGDINFTGELKYGGNSFVTNNTNNYVMTGTGVGTLNGEQNLTFNGSLLNVTGGVDVSGTVDANTVTTVNLTVDTNTLIVDSVNNNVGINTSPDAAYALDVVGDVNLTGSLFFDGDGLITNNSNNFIMTGTGAGTIVGEDNLTFNGTTLNVTGNVLVSSTIQSSTITPNLDSAYNLGSAALRWNTLYIDTIGDIGQTLDVAATTLSFNTATTIDTSGDNQLDIITGTANLAITSSNVTMSGNLTIDNSLTVDTNTLVVDSINNNVGVATTPNAAYSLDVNGDINIGGSGELKIAGNSFVANNTANYIITGEDNGTLNAESALTFDGTLLNLTGNIDVSGTIQSSTITPNLDSTYNLGSAALRWNTLYVDTIGDAGQDLAVDATILSFNTAATINTSGDNQLDIITGAANLAITAANVTVSDSMQITNNFTVDTTTLVVDSANNNVGINIVPNASYTLDVNGNINVANNSYHNGTLTSYWYDDAGDTYRLSNVGIQTSDPQYELDVTHNHAGDTSIASFNNNASGSAHLRVGYDAANHYDIYRNGASADIIHNATQNTANIIWQIAADEKLRIASTGYVGIGTNNPTSIFDIEEAGVTSITLTNTTDSTTLKLTSDATTASIGTVSNTPLQIKGNDLLLATFDYSGLDLELGQIYSINGVPLIPDLDLTAFSVNWPQYTSSLYDAERIYFNDVQNVETTWDWNYAKREMRNKSWFIEQDFPPTHGAIILDASKNVVWWIDRTFGIDGATYFTDYLRFDVGAGNMIQSNINEIKFLDFKLYALATDALYVIDLLDDTAYMYANNGTYKYNSNVFRRNDGDGYTRINSIGLQNNNNYDFDVIRDPFADQDNYTRPLHYWIVTDTAGESLYKPNSDGDDAIYHKASANTGSSVAFINESIIVGEQGTNASVRVTRDFTAITAGGWTEHSDINPTQSGYQTAAWSNNINDVVTIDGPGGSEVMLVGTDDGLSIRHSLSGEVFVTGSYATPFMNEGRKVAFPLNDLNDRSVGGSSTTLSIVGGSVAFTGTSPFGTAAAEFTGGYLTSSVAMGEARNISLFFKTDNDTNPTLQERIIRLSNGISTGRIDLFTDSSGFLNAAWSDDGGSTTDTITSITDLHDGNWHHVYIGAIQEDTANYYMYVDGQHVGKVAISNSAGTLSIDNIQISSAPNNFYGEIAGVYVSDVPYRKEDIVFEYNRMRAGLASSTSVLSTSHVKQISIDSKGGYAVVVTNDNIANIIDAKSGDIYNIDGSPGGTLNHADIISMDSGAAPHYFLGGSTAIEQLAQSTNVLNGGIPISASSNIDNDVSTYVATATGAGKLNGEQNLTFNGTLLNVTGNINYTGTLQKNGVDFVNNAADNRLATTNADGTLNAEANLTFGTTLTIAAATTAQNITPALDSTYTLGTTSDRWSHVYTDDITVTSGLTLGGGGGITGLIANDANNRVTTATGNADLNAEANLTFDGTTLGIGTATPTAGSALDVRGGDVNIDGGTTTNRKLYLRNQSTDTIGGSIQSNETLSFWAGVSSTPTQAVTIERETLYVGVSNTDPAYRLDVTGDINTTTEFRVGGNSLIANNGANHIITGETNGTLNGESALTFDGTTLIVGAGGSGNADINGTITAELVVAPADSLHDLGTTSIRWANAYIDDITITNGISGFIANDTDTYLTTANGNGTLQAESGITFDGTALTITGNVNPVADSAHDLGTTLVRWANAYVDDIVVTNGITIGAGGITGLISNETDNRIITSAGGGLLNAEADLTFNGTILNLTGNLDVSGTIESGTITPEVDSTSDLGTTLLRWANAYIDDITITNGISGLIANDTNNYLTTSTGSGTLNAESALTFNGSVLNITGNITPNSTLTHDLGTTLLYWNNAYINNITISGGITGLIADDTADYLTTSTGSGTLAAHSELTFNGTLLSITGNVDISGTLESGTITPEVTLTSDLGTTLLRWSTIYAGTVDLTSTTGLIAGDTNNYVTTATGSGTLQAESALTFDGTTLNVTGDINFTGNLLEDGLAYIAPVNIANDSDGRITTATGSSSLDAEANLTYDGTTLTVATGGVTVGGNISVDTDSAYDIGADAARVANLFVDDITLTNGTTGLIDNDADNRITTAQADGTFNAEANLTFDGSELIINGVGYEQMTTSIGSSVGNQMVYADLDNMSVTWDENKAKSSIRNTSWYTELGAPPMHGMFTLDPDINTGSINWINREDGTTYMTFGGGNDTGRMFSGTGGWTSIYDIKYLDMKLYVCWKDAGTPVGGVIVIDFVRDEAVQYTTSGLYRWKGNTISNRNTASEGWILIDATADITLDNTNSLGTVSIARDPNGNSDFFGRPEQFFAINMGKKTHLWNPLDKAMYDSSQTDGNGVVALFENGGMFYDHYFVGPPAGQYFRYVNDFTTIDADGFTGTQFTPHNDETYKGRSGTGIETSNIEANGFTTGSVLGNQNLVILNGTGHDTTIFHIDAITPDNSGVITLTDTYVSPYMKGDRFAAWPMKTTADVSGRGVTLANLPATSAGVFGNVATFNGTSDIASATVLASTFTAAEFSVSFIFKSDNTTLPVAEEAILHMERTTNPTLNPWISVRANTSGGIDAYTGIDGATFDQITYTGNLFDSKPHHVAYICDGFKFYLYIDGYKVGELDKTNVNTDLILEDIEIGGSNGGNHFGGQIEMMSISKTALERVEVEFEHYRMQQAIGGMATTYTTSGTFTNFSADRSGDYMIVSADTSLHVMDARTGLIYSNQTITGGTYAEIVSVAGADLPHYAYYDNGSIVQVAPKVRLRS